jgi:hypothetical protein
VDEKDVLAACLPEGKIALLFIDLREANPHVLIKAIDSGFLIRNANPDLLGQRIEDISMHFLESEPGIFIAWVLARLKIPLIQRIQCRVVVETTTNPVPEAEKKAVADGWATKRVLIGSNEFYIVGPPDDPAGIKKAKTAAEAYSLIANSQSKFFSRGDNSGTHKKEMDAWENAKIKPAGDWYIVTNG